MTWALWLAVPVGVTVLAALWSWVRARPPRVPDTAASMRAHTAYLEALGASARARPPVPPVPPVPVEPPGVPEPRTGSGTEPGPDRPDEPA